MSSLNEDNSVLLGVDYRTEAEQARASGVLYDVQIEFRDRTREIVTDATRITPGNDGSGLVEIEYGVDSSVTVAVANIRTVHAKAHADRVDYMTIHDTRERCSDIGPRIGDERGQCVRINHPTDDGSPHQAWYEEGLVTW